MTAAVSTCPCVLSDSRFVSYNAGPSMSSIRTFTDRMYYIRMSSDWSGALHCGCLRIVSHQSGHLPSRCLLTGFLQSGSLSVRWNISVWISSLGGHCHSGLILPECLQVSWLAVSSYSISSVRCLLSTCLLTGSCFIILSSQKRDFFHLDFVIQSCTWYSAF